MNIKYCLLFFLLLSSFAIHAQKVDSDTLISHIQSDVTRFFTGEGLLSESENNKTKNFVFVTEIREQKMLGYNINGIYRIGVLQSHSPQHILIKEKSNFRIYNMNQIDQILKEVIDYSKRNQLDTSTLFSYLEKVMVSYNANYNSPSPVMKLK